MFLLAFVEDESPWIYCSGVDRFEAFTDDFIPIEYFVVCESAVDPYNLSHDTTPLTAKSICFPLHTLV